MKKVILKSMFLSSLLLMTSCASGSYVKSVSFWHIGDFLEFVVIVGLGALVFLLYNKIQSIDDKLSRLIDLLQGNSNPNTYNPTDYVNVQQPQQPQQTAPQQNIQPTPQQPAPQQLVMKYCPDCGASVEANKSACPNCGCPLN